MKYLVVGLGNIGAEYANTRHNIGFMIADRLAEKFKCTFESERQAFVTEFKHKGRSIHLIKPTTYMNLSGKAVRHWMNQLKIPQDNLLVLVDDLALPFGTLRMRAKGSDAGHNGLKNIQELLGNNKYPRLRFGIGDSFSKGKQIDYVLGDFDKKEQEELEIFIEKSCDMVLSFASIGIQRTMTTYNN
ncbi:aminoacyl-tRNA hydrolase [Rapidithrix thailandica]|uniref:Peptidyl-tRNA hydrolase n=1 Tax=Rapidithrix thailandica TaxID=413964 RepID=A0AAW9RYU0_9BACT